MKHSCNKTQPYPTPFFPESCKKKTALFTEGWSLSICKSFILKITFYIHISKYLFQYLSIHSTVAVTSRKSATFTSNVMGVAFQAML